MSVTVVYSPICLGVLMTELKTMLRSKALFDHVYKRIGFPVVGLFAIRTKKKCTAFLQSSYFAISMAFYAKKVVWLTVCVRFFEAEYGRSTWGFRKRIAFHFLIKSIDSLKLTFDRHQLLLHRQVLLLRVEERLLQLQDQGCDVRSALPFAKILTKFTQESNRYIAQRHPVLGCVKCGTGKAKYCSSFVQFFITFGHDKASALDSSNTDRKVAKDHKK